MIIIFRVSNHKILKLKYAWATESDPVSRQNGTQKAALHRVSLACCLKFVSCSYHKRSWQKQCVRERFYFSSEFQITVLHSREVTTQGLRGLAIWSQSQKRAKSICSHSACSHHYTFEEFRTPFLGNGTTVRVYSGFQQYNQVVFHRQASRWNC